ncbi:pyridoxal kinase [Lentilactobacillus farraginis DSM 18382 = JCM 14108]|uniref:pyridoxal kinase n=3 Tax=Lentilactobacillus farraginis TaxID=390841 RepID=A0A0R1V8H1_9LACO|nr:pyridoxal kinase [Lentilactobacillus farraginis DSM 18382 = JCM 14108]
MGSNQTRGLMIIYEPSILVAEDFSAVGRLSMTAAISVFSGFGLQTAAMPTEVLSTQTEGFGRPAIFKTDDWIEQAMRHWQAISDLNLNAALVGYVGNIATVTLLTNLLRRSNMAPVVIDPVLGDQGKMYAGFDSEYLAAVKKLLATATVITPNVTELGLLTNTKLTPTSSDKAILAALTTLDETLTNHPRVVVTGVRRDAGMGSCFTRNGRLVWNGSPFVTGHFYGTGDLFSALMTGYLVFGMTFESAVQRAVSGTYEAVSQTAQLASNRRKYGLNLTKTLNAVTKFTLGQKRGEF